MDFTKPRFWKTREQLDCEIGKVAYLLDCEMLLYDDLKEKMLKSQQRQTDLEYFLFKLRQQPAYDDAKIITHPLYDIAGNLV